ncbi:MAG TPA: hypothetical protein VK623_00380 [Flavobacterium sp.]|nr:hypothetical protein [Flavobacterium sp.]
MQEKESGLASRTELEDQFDFTISEKAVNVVEVDGKTFYNILMNEM